MTASILRARSIVMTLAGLLALTLLAGCATVPAPGGGPRINPARPVPVALLLPLSDPDAAPVAQDIENAVRLAIAELPAVRIDLQVLDTAGDPATAAAAARQAVAQGARIIIGPLRGEAANAAGQAVRDRGINVLSFSNNTGIAGGNVFILGQTFANTADRLVGYAVARGLGRVLVVRPDNLEGAAGARAIRAAVNRNGATMAGEQVFAFSREGVIDAVPQIVESAGASAADVLFLTSTPAGALPFLAQLLPEHGLGPDAIQWIGLARWDIPAQTLSLPGLQGGWFAMPDQAAQQAFAARYRERYGRAPHPLAGLGFDAIAAIGALAAEGKGDALTVRALTQPAGFRGASGVFRLLPDGTNQRALAVAEVQEGRAVVIDPAPQAFAGY